jgi:hypothetical protein
MHVPQPELIPEPAVAAAIGSAPLEQPEVAAGPEPVHLVVVTSRGLTGGEMPSAGATLRTRFWHPRDGCWSENDFESLEHALRLFVDESGWQLLQEQGLDEPLAREWVFRARRSDFEHPTQEQLLGEIGLTPDGVEQLLKDVSPAAPDDGAAEAGPSC